MTSTITTREVNEGGENLFLQKLPTGVTYDDLVLERGLVIGSILSNEFNLAMSTMRFQPSNVLIMVLNSEDAPIVNWLCQDAYPIEWSVSDLDATQNAVVIETMKLHYGRLQRVSI